ncbi:protein AAR2 homolog isoform X2 [Carica papaya]|uniref:protein AAR2 homolog isoform X2 n=1 Tax=Carica papaya TaxID=3649 RepID=UPI000B8CBCBF|nr:protein AAR2 homolog isoform X2 [Carica papaya]
MELLFSSLTFLSTHLLALILSKVTLQMSSVGPAFKGIKMIPPGPHFVFYSSSSRDGKEYSPVIGFFMDAAPHLVYVRKWDQQNERLVKMPEEEEERYSQAVRSLEFDKYLGPYNLSHYGEWKRLSNFITKDIIERIEPIVGEITVTCESETMKIAPRTTMEKALDEQLRNSKCSTTVDKFQGRECYYTSIPRVIKSRGIQGEALTSLNLDKTQLLESLLTKDYGGSEDALLGELQFAFIAFLMGQSLEAFLQWKSLVSLLFGCTEAPFYTRSQLFTKFIKVIYYQLKYGLRRDDNGRETGGPSILDDSWFTTDNFLHHLCKDFFALVEDASAVDGDLLSWTRKFKELLEESLGWQFQQKSVVDGLYFEEDDEYAPVVEMLDGTNYEEASTA